MIAPLDWQPIESAPKDGTRILITDGWRVHADAWEHVQYFCNGQLQHESAKWSCWYDDEHGPTHWAAIPPLPEVGDA